MARFRVEAVIDIPTKLYRAEVYYPADSIVPLFVSKAIYGSREKVIEDAVQIFMDATSGKSVKVIPPGTTPPEQLH